jgi:translation initiation factor IF-2
MFKKSIQRAALAALVIGLAGCTVNGQADDGGQSLWNGLSDQIGALQSPVLAKAEQDNGPFDPLAAQSDLGAAIFAAQVQAYGRPSTAPWLARQMAAQVAIAYSQPYSAAPADWVYGGAKIGAAPEVVASIPYGCRSVVVASELPSISGPGPMTRLHVVACSVGGKLIPAQVSNANGFVAIDNTATVYAEAAAAYVPPPAPVRHHYHHATPARVIAAAPQLAPAMVAPVAMPASPAPVVATAAPKPVVVAPVTAPPVVAKAATAAPAAPAPEAPVVPAGPKMSL